MNLIVYLFKTEDRDVEIDRQLGLIPAFCDSTPCCMPCSRSDLEFLYVFVYSFSFASDNFRPS
jgi:hypothetical protein